MRLTTTLKLLREHNACESGYRKLRKHLGKGWGNNEPIDLLTILDSNGVADTLWCLRATREDSRRIAALIAADLAERVLPIWEAQHPNDDRPRKAIKAARAGDPNAALTAARVARTAACDAAYSAYAAACDAAYSAFAAACDAADVADAAAYSAFAAAHSACDAYAAFAVNASFAVNDSELAAQADIIRKHLRKE